MSRSHYNRPDMGDAVLSINDAMKRFDQTQALAGASFELHRGEWLGLLGPNGAGKTTLVRAIAGRVRLDGGDITLLGSTFSGHGRASVDPGFADARKRLGIVPQEAALYPALTARENLVTFGELNGLRGKDLRAKVDHALEWTGLADRANDRAETFSGGMKRRLNLACGVLHEPEIVLLDEPTVGVDPQSRQRIWDMLRELQSRGVSLLLTTHQLDEAQQVCERIVIIDHGKDIAAGTFEELLHETIGPGRRVVIHLNEEPSPSLLGNGFEPAGDNVLARQVGDLAAELPGVLREIEQAGATVRDLQVESPTLQAVFIHLTGRELRE